MLIAYLDEFGHVGPYVADGHVKFGHHPVFGYAGVIVPSSVARDVGADFKRVKTSLFKTEIDRSANPSQWERKGSEYFSTGSIRARPEQVRAFAGLMTRLRSRGGRLFYSGDEKPRGTLVQTGRTSQLTTRDALPETINRICRHAERSGDDVLIIADSITDKTRVKLVGDMYAHIYGRNRNEMRRIVEAPLHIESKLNSNIQLADWVCALISRASHYHLVESSEFGWAPRSLGKAVQGLFAPESKIQLRDSRAIHGDEIVDIVSLREPTLLSLGGTR